MRAGALAEDFEDEAGAVDDLGLPAAFEVALLHRGERRIDGDKADIIVGDDAAQHLDIPAAERGRGARRSHPDDLGANHIEVDGPGEPCRLREPCLGRARRRFGGAAGADGFGGRMNDQRAAGRGGGRGFAAAQSSPPSRPPSNSWMGCAGITVEIACLYTSCECASRPNTTQKLSNQVIIPCNFTPFTRKTVTAVLFLRTWFRKTS